MISVKALKKIIKQTFCEHLDERVVIIGSQCASNRDSVSLTSFSLF